MFQFFEIVADWLIGLPGLVLYMYRFSKLDPVLLPRTLRGDCRPRAGMCVVRSRSRSQYFLRRRGCHLSTLIACWRQGRVHKRHFLCWRQGRVHRRHVFIAPCGGFSVGGRLLDRSGSPPPVSLSTPACLLPAQYGIHKFPRVHSWVCAVFGRLALSVLLVLTL